MAGIKRFEEILGWQKARELVRETYRACGIPPFAKDFGLKSDLPRRVIGYD